MKYAIVAAAVFAGDFVVKEHIEKQRDGKEETVICSNKVVVKKYHNTGAAFNFMEQRPGLVKGVCGAVLFALAMLWCICSGKKGNPGMLLGLSLSIGGGASNFYDRVKRGYVVDYFSFCTPFQKLNQVIFNISDLCIFLGSLMVAVFGKKQL
ncbi:MAG: signal peptidase II [Lachnospiraceae bacterium]|jgi:signal peptidase II|nr:signal peptidase II [Lachnospiraceae bacterium]